MDLEVLTDDELSVAVREEVCAFLDSQDTSHPFRFPQWTGPDRVGNTILRYVWRERNAITAYASCGPQRPAGTRVPLKALVINRGPVCDDAEMWCEIVNNLGRIARDGGLMYIDAAPERVISDSGVALFPPGWKPLGRERTSLRLELMRSEEEIFAGFRRVARYEARRAERAGVHVTMASSDVESEWFVDLYLRLAERKGFAADRPEFVRAVLKWLLAERERGGLFLAWHEAVAIGGAVVVRAGRRCWYVWGASEERRDLSAGHVLQWNAIRWAKAQGCIEYDFGGYTPGARSGPAWFKEGFGGKVTRFVPTHRLVLRETQYRLLQVARSARRKLQRSND